MKQRFLTLALLLCVSLGARAGDEMHGISVEYVRVGTPDYRAAISTIGRLRFSGGLASIIFKNGDTYVLGTLKSLKRIYLGVLPDHTATQALTVVVYPNPVADVLHITGQKLGETIRLIALDGRVVATTTGTDIPVFVLPMGVYFLQCGTQIVKVIKK